MRHLAGLARTMLPHVSTQSLRSPLLRGVGRTRHDMATSGTAATVGIENVGSPSAFDPVHNPSSQGRSGVVPVEFGGRRRRSQSRREAAAKTEQDIFNERIKAAREEEELAWIQCSAKGFAVKPPFHSWSSFADELRRFEVQWALGSPSEAVFVWTLHDHKRAERLCCLRSVAKRSVVTHLMLSATEEAFYAASRQQSVIPFTDESEQTQLLLFQSRMHASAPPAAIAAYEAAAAEEVRGDVPTMVRKAPSTEWLVVRGAVAAVGEDTMAFSKPPMFEVALPTMAYWQATSLVAFLNMTQWGAPNYRRMGRRQVAELREVYDRLRQCAGMHPSPWPIEPHMLSRD